MKNWGAESKVPEPVGPSFSIPIEYKEPGFVEHVNNDVLYYSDVTQEKILQLVRVLKEKEEELIAKKIVWNLEEYPTMKIHINSYGGAFHAAVAAMDHIRGLRVKTETIIDGVTASAATLLSIVGDKRKIQKNAYILIHQLSTVFWGNYEEIKDQKENMDNFMKTLNNIYTQHTKLTKAQLKDMLKHDIYLDANDALKYGLVDEIIG